jgi:hypothetical protein
MNTLDVRAHPHSAVNLSRTLSAYVRELYYDPCLYEP